MMRKRFNARWTVFYLLALVAGILTAWFGLFYGRFLPILLLCCTVPVMLVSLVLFFCTARSRFLLLLQRNAMRILSVGLLMLLGYCSLNYQLVRTESFALPQGEYQITGRITEIVLEESSDGVVTGMVLDRVRLVRGDAVLDPGGRINARFEGETDADFGDVISFSGSLLNVSAVYRGAVNTSFLGSGIRYRVYAGDAAPEILGHRSNLVIDLRKSFREVLSQNLDGRSFGVGYALMFGDKSYLLSDDYQTFRDIGVLHIFAVSGLHVGFLLILLNLVLKRVSNWLRFFGVTLILLLYLFLCNFSPSVTRAVTMCIVATFAGTVGASRDRLNIVALSALALFVINPLYLFSMGFLMSLTAILSIVMLSVHMGKALNYLSARLESRVPPKGIRNLLCRLLHRIADSLSVTISAQLGMLPLLMHYFGKVPAVAFAANLILVPFVELTFMVLFLFALLAVLIPQIGAILTVPGGLLKALVWAFEGLAGWNLGQIALYSLGGLTVVYYIALALTSDKLFLKNRWRAMGCAVCAVILVTGYLWSYLPSPAGSDRIVVPDIGYRAAIVEMQTGQRALIDLERDRSQYENLIEYLHQSRIETLELVILPDCGPGALNLVMALSREIRLESLVVPKTSELEELYVTEALRRFGEVIEVGRNSSFRFGDQLFYLAEQEEGCAVYTVHGGAGVLMGVSLQAEQLDGLAELPIDLVIDGGFSAKLNALYQPAYYICNKYYGENGNIYGLNECGGLIFSCNHGIIEVNYDKRLYL